MMRLAIFHNLPSGGGKRALCELTRRLSERHAIDVYTLSCAEHDFGDARPYVAAHHVQTFRPSPLCRSPLGRLNQGIRAYDLMRLDRLYRRLAAAIEAGGYDAVFVHNCQFMASPSLLFYLRAPSVYYCQEPPRVIAEPPVPRPYAVFSRWQRLGNHFDPLPALYRGALRRLDRRGMLNARRVLVNSHYSRETLYRTYGIMAHVAYLGVDAERFHPQNPAKGDFVLSVGALNARKGFDFLIQSLGQLAPDVRLPLVVVSNFADVRERLYLESLAAAQKVNVTFRTMVSDGELVALYNQALLVLYAPVMEPFGFAPLEAMACGTPVVGVAEAGVRESVRHGETGLLTERDPSAFAQAVARLLADPHLRGEMGRRGRVHVLREWTWDAAAARIEAHLEAVRHG